MKRTTAAVTVLMAMIVAISSFTFVRPAQEKDIERLAGLAMMAPVNISNTPSDSGYPLIGVNSSGAAYVVWWEFSNPEVLFTTNKSGSWISPQRAAVIRYQRDEAEYYKGFSVAPNGECHLTYLDVDLNITNYEVWHAFYNGNSWETPNNISQTSNSSQASKCAVNPTNNAMTAVWMDETYRLWDIMSRSRQSNGNWTSVQTCPIGGLASSPSIAIDANGRGHLAWANRLGGTCEVWYARNDNPLDANGWTTKILLASNTGNVWWTFAEVDCDNAGNAYVCWQDSRPGNDEIYMRKVNSNGTLAPEVNVSQSGASSTDPDIAVNKNNGNIYVAWTENGNVYMNSCTGGSWVGTSRITNSGTASGPPCLAVDAGGNIHLVYSEASGGSREIFYLTTSQGPNTSTTTSTGTTSTTSIPIVQPKPPINPVLNTGLDASQTAKTNTLAWERNPENNNIELKEYGVYRKRSSMSDSDFARIASVSSGTFQYADRGLPLNQKYTYGLTAVPKDPNGLESEGSEFVSERSVFPPLNVVCKSVVNNSLFRREKINVISWNANPLNTPITIAQYNIYRKKSDQNDSAYTLVASVAGSAAEYWDRKLSFTEKYVYIVKTFDSGGNESLPSNAAGE